MGDSVEHVFFVSLPTLYEASLGMTSDKYTFIDLFAGCGGLSEGFLSTGRFRSLAHVEWEKPMVDVLRKRLVQKWGRTEQEAINEVILFDIQKTEELINGDWQLDSIEKFGRDNSQLIQTRGLKGLIGEQNVNLIIGGPPCQSYSIHGRATDKNSMQDDYRNFLFESFCRVVDAFRPDLFVFENVAGLLSARPGGVPVRNRIYEAFSNIGYRIVVPERMPEVLYDAGDFGVPQHRPRVIILGIKRDSRLSLEELYLSIASQKSPSKRLTVRDAIGHLPPLYPLDRPIREGRKIRSHTLCPDNTISFHEARNHSERDRAIFRDWVKNGMNHLSHQEMIDYYYGVTGHKTLFQKYKSLEWDKPSHTVVAHLSKDGYMFIHPDAKQERSITVREAACLMTFPMDYVFSDSTPYNYRMIGNAVPVNFAKLIATGIYKVLDKIEEE